jgi:hypothetical protein
VYLALMAFHLRWGIKRKVVDSGVPVAEESSLMGSLGGDRPGDGG